MKISLLFMWMWKCEPSKNLQTDILKEGPTKRSRVKGNERWGLWKIKVTRLTMIDWKLSHIPAIFYCFKLSQLFIIRCDSYICTSNGALPNCSRIIVGNTATFLFSDVEHVYLYICIQIKHTICYIIKKLHFH